MINFKLLYELAYDGNIGLQELMMFYRAADDEQSALLDQLLDGKKFREAVDLIEVVTGVRLHMKDE